MNDGFELATFAGGCFWCTEAIFKRLKGVNKVTSGYSGGTVKNPTYEQVVEGHTGYAEAIQITYNPTIISYKQLLEVFFHLHDPTTRNQQGNDVGSQYRSIIFYHNASQQKLAEEVRKEIENAKVYKDSIVTEIILYTNFYKAEGYHQDFYENNKDYPYCKIIIDPKIKKLFKEFSSLVEER